MIPKSTGPSLIITTGVLKHKDTSMDKVNKMSSAFWQQLPSAKEASPVWQHLPLMAGDISLFLLKISAANAQKASEQLNTTG